MTEINASMVKKLREMTGAGMLDCKSALTEAKGDFDSAVEVLRKKGLKDVAKRAGKQAAEGTIGTYIHPGDQVVAIVELNCETDFVARGDEFKELARGIAMHIAAMSPKYISSDQVDQGEIEKEKAIYLEQLTDAQKKNADKILEGKINKYFEEIVLLNQIYVKDETGKKTINEIIQTQSAKTGEKIVIRRFQRLAVGEGIEKTTTDLAADVAALTSN